MEKKDAGYWVKRLRLEPHPEGGYFRQTYRSETTIPREALPAGFGGDRAAFLRIVADGQDIIERTIETIVSSVEQRP